MAKPIVLIEAGSPHPDAGPEHELLDQVAELRIEAFDDNQRWLAALAEVTAVMVDTGHRYDATAFAVMRRCRIISRYGIGYDNIDTEAAAAAGIWVSRVPDYGWEDVSDHAVALFFACVRNLRVNDLGVRSDAWGTAGAPSARKMYRIKGRTLGLVGCGNIGRFVIRKLSGAGLARVLVFDPYLPAAEVAALGAEAVDLETVLRQSDYVSVHAPLTDETHHMIGAAQLQMMRRTAILINTARGPIIDESALAAALTNGTIAAAGIDVFEEEPLPPSSPLIGLENTILSGHKAWLTEESREELARKAALNVAEVLAGRPPIYPVNQPPQPRP